MAILRLDDAVATALRAQAAMRGLSLEAYLRTIAERSSVTSTTPGDARDFDAALDQLFSAELQAPPPTSNPYSRDEIYDDHD